LALLHECLAVTSHKSSTRFFLRKSLRYRYQHNNRSLSTSGALRQDPFAQQKQAEVKQKNKATREADEDEATKTSILNSSLKFVCSHGWSQLALSSGAEALGHPSVVAGLFPHGGQELVLHHVRTCNKRLDAIMKEEVEQLVQEGGRLNIGKFIRKFVEVRLRMNQEFLLCDKWSEAMAILANPSNACDSLSCMQELCDDIWHRAGDKSSDLNWYSKRISLAAVYGSTELFMVQDKSHDFNNTWTFLDRRFQDLSLVQSAGSIPQELGKFAAGALVTSKNILGFN